MKTIKNIVLKSFVIAVVMLFTTTMFAQSPKRDVRATWLSTAWALDWPKSGTNNITVPAPTGSNEAARETVRNTQKKLLTDILDKLQVNNFNTVFFQVRSMCEAFYNSKYEPWSQWLSSVHGADPGWDPLAFIVEEGHKRGIEVHAWLNPYRYSTASTSHTGLSNDYEVSHPDWLLDYGSYSKILNPGMPEVRQQICKIVADIVSNYDVDGIIFDDYFYMQQSGFMGDSLQYRIYNPDGLSLADWRRNNVNQMVKDVQSQINTIKPYVTFGISPAGVAGGGADKHGVEPSPVGSDWQYNGIYSDPLAWLEDGSIDYISPQLYWTIGSGNDYSKLSPWWAKVANHFGRHFYSSNSSPFSATELVDEVTINRDADLNGTTGSVYFRTNNLSQTSLTALKGNVYQQPALRAAYGWKVAPIQTLVDNLSLSGQVLSWNYADNTVRYSIYAIPNERVNDDDAFTSPKYLQGIAYTRNYILLPSINASTHKIAVSVYDRYGNEFPPRILNEAMATIAAPQLTYPANNIQDLILPALFTWQKSVGALYYIWELAEDAAFTKPIVTRETATPEFNSALQANVKENTVYYWRVKVVSANAPIAISEVRSFKGTKFRITSPSDGTEGVSMHPTFTWTAIGANANYTLEISDKSDFSKIVYTADVQESTASVESDVLITSTRYYARVKVKLGAMQAISERIYFVTEHLPVPVPILISPIDGANIIGSEIEISWQQQNSKGFRAELSKSADFPVRSTTLKSVDAFTYSAVYTGLAEGTYYLRVRAKDSEGLTEPSDYVTVYLSTALAVDNVSALETSYVYYDSMGNSHIVINSNSATQVTVDIYSLTGVMMERITHSVSEGKNTLSPDMSNYTKGFYLIKIRMENSEKTLKVRR